MRLVLVQQHHAVRRVVKLVEAENKVSARSDRHPTGSMRELANLFEFRLGIIDTGLERKTEEACED